MTKLNHLGTKIAMFLTIPHPRLALPNVFPFQLMTTPSFQ